MVSRKSPLVVKEGTAYSKGALQILNSFLKHICITSQFWQAKNLLRINRLQMLSQNTDTAGNIR
jgi:hypothetical protein